MRWSRLAAAPLLAAAVLAASPANPSAATTPPVGGPLLAGRGLVLAPGAPAPPHVKAASWVVADARTGAVVAAKAPHLRLRPASTLKTLTALTLQPTLSPRQVHVGTDADTRVEGSRAGIVAGGRYTVEQLFQAVFLQSGNDAALALAELHGGVPRTVADMNAEARHLQALDTHAVTPDGLDEDGQVSSAYDLALLGRAALANPALVRYATTRSARFPGGPAVGGGRHRAFELWTQQTFVERYPGALGLKNGYTTLARNTLIAAARHGDRTVIVTLMRTGPGAWREAASLADWFFARGYAATPVGELVTPVAAHSTAPPARTTAGGPVSAVGGAAASLASQSHPAGSRHAQLLGVPAAMLLLVGGLRARVLWRRRRRIGHAARSGAGVPPLPRPPRSRRTDRTTTSATTAKKA